MAVIVRPDEASAALDDPALPSWSCARSGWGVDQLSAVLAFVLLGVLVVGLAVSAHQRARMPFGDSHDGRNAGVWAENSRSLREQGPVASRLGTRALVGGEVRPYATHPPLIAVEAAAAEAVLGERPWVTRLPAWGGSLAALVLAFLLLRECRLRPLAAAMGVAVGFGCPMVATYGTMLDTPMVGLPFGIAVLWLWQRGRSGRPAPTAVAALVSVLAVLTSWLGLLTVVLVAAASLLPLVRRRLAASPAGPRAEESNRNPGIGFVLGALGGTALVLLWIAWGYGSLGPLADQLLLRTRDRGEQDGLARLIGTLRYFGPRVFTPAQLLLVIPAVVAAVQRRHTRAVAVVALAVVAMWVGGFRDGAIHHDYWTYWMVIPLAIGVGVIAEAALEALCQHQRGAGAAPRRRRLAGQVALAGCSAGLALSGTLATSAPAKMHEAGQDGGWLISSASYPPGQRRAWVLQAEPEIVSWVSYQSGLPMATVLPADLDDLVARAPFDLVLAGATSGPPSAVIATASCLPMGSVRGHNALVSAAALHRALQPSCS